MIFTETPIAGAWLIDPEPLRDERGFFARLQDAEAFAARGLVGSIGERVVVASPIYKQHFDLRTGECLEAPHNSVSSYPVRVEDGQVLVGA